MTNPLLTPVTTLERLYKCLFVHVHACLPVTGLFAFLAILLVAIPAHANDPVCDNTVVAGDAIQPAINAADSLHVICVEPGTYNEELHIETGHISLVAADESSAPVLQGTGTAILITEADSVRIEGFEIRNSDRAIQLDGSMGVRIINNLITENEWGIHDSFSSGSDSTIVTGNTITNNSIRGVHLDNIRDVIFSNNTVNGNAGSASGLGMGIRIGGTSSVTENHIEGNGDVGIWAVGPENHFENNTIIDHQYGITLARPQGNAADHASVVNNTITGSNTGINLQAAHVELINNTITGNVVDVVLSSAHFATLTDNTFESGITLEISNVIADVFDHTMSGNTVNGDPLFFANGVSSPDIPADAAQIILYDVDDVTISAHNFDGVAAAIQIGFSSNLEISGNNITNIGGQAIGVFGSPGASIINNTVTLSGDIISVPALHLSHSSNSTITGNTVTDNLDQGISVTNSTDVTVNENHSSDNARNGLFVANNSHRVHIEDNTFNNNGSRGIRLFSQSEDATITGNTINGNEEQGIWDGLWSQEPGATITDNQVENNGREGIDYRSRYGTIIGNTVTGNDGIFGGINVGRDGVVRNNTVTDNNTYGINGARDVLIEENTVTGNTMGIRISIARDVIVRENEVNDNGDHGIFIERADDGHFNDNIISGHYVDIMIGDQTVNATINNNTMESGIAMHSHSVEMDELVHSMSGNTVRDNKPLFFAKGVDNPSIPSDAGQIIIGNSTNVDISGFEFSDMTNGIQVAFSDNVQITDNTITGSTPSSTYRRGAITVWGANDVQISGNTLSENGGYSIEVFQTEDLVITGNSLANNARGLYLTHSDDGIISENIVESTTFMGMEVEQSPGVGLLNNHVSNGGHHGIKFTNSNGARVDSNTIEHSERIGMYFESTDSIEVRGNTIAHSGESGLESHFGFRTSDEAVISGNTITYSAEYGINFNVDGAHVYDNHIADNQDGIRIGAPADVEDNRIENHTGVSIVVEQDAEEVVVTGNSFTNNADGLDYSDATPLLATGNWWGDAGGPSGGADDPETGTTADGTGDPVAANVRFDPWLSVDPVDDPGTDPGEVITVTSCMDITQSGQYELDGDLSGSNGCLTITANDVALDGLGHTITGQGNGSGYAIDLDGSDGELSGITVKNVNLEQWDTGLRVFQIRESEFTDIAASDHEESGISVSAAAQNQFTNISISNSGSESDHYGFQLAEESHHNELQDIVISSGTNGLSLGTDSTLVDTLEVSDMAGTAVRLWQEAADNTLSNLVMSDNGTDYESGNGAEDNKVEHMTLDNAVISFQARDVQINNTDPPADLPGDLQQLDHFVEIVESPIAGDSPLAAYLRFHYDPNALDDTAESSLEVWRHHNNDWTAPAYESYTSGVDTDEAFVYADNISDFSVFAVMSSDVATSSDLADLPEVFRLAQNYPNPFNPITTIRYELPEAADVQLEVYNLLGERVTTLVDSNQNAGRYDVGFDGSSLSSGVYVYRLRAGDFVKTMKLTLIK